MLKFLLTVPAYMAVRAVQYIIILLAFTAIYSRATNISNSNICVDNLDNYADTYFYYWNVNTANELIDVAWPGIKMTRTGNFYCHDVRSSITTTSNASMNVIFNNDNAQQTQDLVYQSGKNCYQNNIWKTLQECGFNSS